MLWWILFAGLDVAVVYGMLRRQRTKRRTARVLDTLSGGQEWSGSHLAFVCDTPIQAMSRLLEELERDGVIISRPQFAYDDTPTVRLWKLAPPQVMP